MPAAPNAANPAVVTLRLDRGTETISGTVATEQRMERPFWGWLELSEALDETRGIAARQPVIETSRMRRPSSSKDAGP